MVPRKGWLVLEWCGRDIWRGIRWQEGGSGLGRKELPCGECVVGLPFQTQAGEQELSKAERDREEVGALEGKGVPEGALGVQTRMLIPSSLLGACPALLINHFLSPVLRHRLCLTGRGMESVQVSHRLEH